MDSDKLRVACAVQTLRSLCRSLRVACAGQTRRSLCRSLRVACAGQTETPRSLCRSNSA